MAEQDRIGEIRARLAAASTNWHSFSKTLIEADDPRRPDCTRVIGVIEYDADKQLVLNAPADIAHLLAEVERLRGERDSATLNMDYETKRRNEAVAERDQFAARLAASERQRQALVEAGEVAERVKVASVTVLECIDDPLFLSAEALKNSPHVAELRAALAAAATPEPNIRYCKGCRGPYHGRALLPSDCARAAAIEGE